MQGFNSTENRSTVVIAKTMLLLSVSLLLIGTIGYVSQSRDVWAFYAFAHLGALGLMGLFGSAAGYVATKKQRSYPAAFLLGSLPPIIAGLVAVFVFWLPEGGHLYCGGVVCLAVGLVVVVVYLFVGKKPPLQASGASPNPS